MKSWTSLSTIPEESKSQVVSQSVHSSISRCTNQNSSCERSVSRKDKSRLGCPAAGNPLCTSKVSAQPLSQPERRHTILKGTSREFRIPPRATILRDASLRDKLMFHISETKQPLFPAVFSQPSTKSERPSVLVTGFGLRNLGSLQEILELEQQKKRLQQLYRPQEEQNSSSSSSSRSASSDSNVSPSPKPSSMKSQSSSHSGQINFDLRNTYSQHKKLSYLMGLPEVEEETVRTEYELSRSSEEPEKASVFVPTSESCRTAQEYLRIHKIFEFFQFITCHLLSILPDDPVTFILELLDECLVYRAGLMKPPLLFRRRHIETLYKMMDRMGTGIDLKQYKAGMRTLGICCFEKEPNKGPDGLIKKDDFLEDAYRNVTHALDDLIRRHWMRGGPVIHPLATPTPQISSTGSSLTSDTASSQFRKSRLFLT